MNVPALAEPDLDKRFGGIARLYSQAGLERLRAAHVCVIGIGGVGSWAAEALARSGIGQLTLMDLDEVCVSNVNRQLHATEDEIGKPKVTVMASRIAGINPGCRVNPRCEFYTERNADAILAEGFDFVVDAIDSVKHKCHLIAKCRETGTPAIIAGGAGGLRDATQIQIADLARSYNDNLLGMVRKKLRGDYGFPKGEKKKFGIDCVFSTELPVFPQRDGTVCAERPEGENLRLNCDFGFGTATFVTGTFGFAAAGYVVSKLTQAAG